VHIERNLIGTGIDPKASIQNGKHGILVQGDEGFSSKDNTIGPHPKEKIRDDDKKLKSTRNTIQPGGQLNGELGIDIADAGVTTDNMPVLSTAAVIGQSTFVTGSLN